MVEVQKIRGKARTVLTKWTDMGIRGEVFIDHTFLGNPALSHAKLNDYRFAKATAH